MALDVIHHPPRPPADVSLDDKFQLEEGTIFLSGVQALVRVVLDARRADRRAGLDTAAFVSGYQGSPLGTFDSELARQEPTLRELGIVNRPGLNEELAATSVMGTQLVGTLPGARHAGVTGFWYGKTPGVDRASDALRHGALIGAGALGGAVVFAGDDTASKSSTIPGDSTLALADLGLAVLVPADVQDVLDLGAHAVALSRASGLWSALRIVTNVADGTGTAVVAPDRIRPVVPQLEIDGRPFAHVPTGALGLPNALELERTLYGERFELARRYAALNGLDRLAVDAPDAWLGVVAAGKPYNDLRQGLLDVGLSDDLLRRLGVRILKVGLVHPLDGERIRSFARGLDEVLVVEEKRPFLESAVKDALYHVPDRPRVSGKADPDGRPLLAADRELDATSIARAVLHRLADRLPEPQLAPHLERLPAVAAPAAPLSLPRVPYFCSGCPHNISTKAPDDALVGVGIGCHVMVAHIRKDRGRIAGVMQMGGEGAQWIGMAPFTSDGHLIQNMGDGTYFHSGSLAIRAAVAAGVNITFKLLYNRAVAMTGGQEAEGAIAVPQLLRELEAEGVRRIIVTADDPTRYRGVEVPAIAEVWPRHRLQEAQDVLRTVDGTTVLVHDQQCAAEARRARKRGLQPRPRRRVWINDRVCEGCGDCGVKSSCLSLRPVDTEFGRKTEVHQASCNQDLSCLEGDCPSFVTIDLPDDAVSAPGAGRELPPPPDVELPAPVLRVPADDFVMRMPGIGGTGVVTVSQILGMAATLDGKRAWGLDQTGLSQKAGPVVSDVRITAGSEPRANKASNGGCDLLLGFDLLGAADARNLVVADPQRTVAVVSTSAVPTGGQVTDVDARFPQFDELLDRIDARTRRADRLALDASALCETLFGSDVAANVLALGAAYQHGALPLSVEAIERAIELNGTAAAANRLAFAWGRACVVAPDLVASLDRTAQQPPAGKPPARLAALIDELEPDDELRRVLELRAADLVGYQSRGYAARYLAAVRSVLERERAATGTAQVAAAYARGLYKLMAYKDEYEVARLHLDAAQQAKLAGALGGRGRVRWHLHPPVLRALGVDRKLELGGWFKPVLAGLRAGRRLRGTPLDPFGRAAVRRLERELIGEYEELVGRALEHLDMTTLDAVTEIAALPDLVRGYEEVKLRNVARFREEAGRLAGALEESTR